MKRTADVTADTQQGSGAGAALAVRAFGACMLLLVLLPAYNLLAHRGTGAAGVAAVETAAGYRAVMMSGLLLVALFAAVGYIVPADVPALFARAGDRLARMRSGLLAAMLGVVSAVITAAFSLLVLGGWPGHIDAVAQFLHARFAANGMLAAPAAFADFWIVQNTLVTDTGWLSQYPPAHVLMLSLFMRAGAAVLMGPLLAGAIAAGGALLAARLWPHDARLARLAALAIALSPFMLFLAGSYMNHMTAVAFMVWGGWALTKARDHAAWAVLSGVLFSAAFAVRPLAALVAAFAFALTVPALPGIRGESRPWSLRWLLTLLGACAGALPGVVFQLGWNAHFFGSPATFGYDVALGPSAGLGFGVDPWGNLYGLKEAIGWTAAELTLLGAHLFEAPLASVLVIGAGLLVMRRPDPGTRVLAAWAGLTLVAGLFYWHHGFYMGPRMLSDAAPAWAALFAVAAVRLVRSVGDASPIRFRLRNALTVALALSTGAGLLLFAPQRARSYAVERVPVTEAAVPAGSIVFVHGGWSARVVARMAGAGVRADRIETLLRQNPTCSVHMVSLAIADGDADRARVLLGRLDTVPRPVALVPMEIGPGSQIRGDLPADAYACAREAASDRAGAIDPAALVWRGRPPVLGPGGGAAFVRDMGPERNAEFLAEHPDATALLLYRDPDGRPVLAPYADAASWLWSASVGPSGHPARPAADLSD